MSVRASLAVLSCVLVWACASRGPGRIQADRFDYNQAVGQSSSEQMLLNIVRLRYSDVPEFLAINSVLAQYVFSASGTLSGAVGTSLGDDANSAGLSATGRFIERPTITYTPLKGEEFVAQMLTPLPADALFALVQSGWPADLLLSMGIERVNGVSNFPFDASVSSSEANVKRFHRGVELLLALAYHQAIEVQAVSEDEEARYFVIAQDADTETQALIDEARTLFGLDPEVSRFRVTSRRLGLEPDEITIRNRSLLTLMGFLSRGVEAPESHVSGHRVRTLAEAPDGAPPIPLRVHSSEEPPPDAAVAVEYRGHWFYIEATDYESLETFGLVKYLYLLMSPRLEGVAPVLTVST